MSRRFWTPLEQVREVPPTPARCAPDAEIATALAELSEINDYFAVGTGPVDEGWRSVEQLYADPGLLDGVVERVRMRIGAAEYRVGASIFFLGFATRLWSVGVGAVVGHRLVPELAADRLLFREVGGQIALHLARPIGCHGDDLGAMLADSVLNSHLAPLSTALHGLGQISRALLRGNAVSALLGAAHQYDRNRGATSPGPAWQLARRLCADERLVGTVRFTKAGYRRLSCCLYYRTPSGGLCGDCAFARVPGTVGREDAS